MPVTETMINDPKIRSPRELIPTLIGTARALMSAFIICFGGASEVIANAIDELEDMEGWCIVAVKTIEGYVDDDERDDGFEGCNYGRKIIFTDGTYLSCASYGYQYAYRPDAIIFAKEFVFQNQNLFMFKMLVDDEMYDMSVQ